MLESELKLAVAAAQQAEKAHQAEVRALWMCWTAGKSYSGGSGLTCWIGPPHMLCQHRLQLASMDADRKRLLAERRHLLGKLKDIEAVEDSVKELYVQMKVQGGPRERGDGQGVMAVRRRSVARDSPLLGVGSVGAQSRRGRSPATSTGHQSDVSQHSRGTRVSHMHRCTDASPDC